MWKAWIANCEPINKNQLEGGADQGEWAYDSVAAARTNIADYFDWYNTERPHSKLDRQTPQQTLDELAAQAAAGCPK